MGQTIDIAAYGPTEEVAIQSLISSLDAHQYIIMDEEYNHPFINIEGSGRYKIITRQIKGDYKGRELWHCYLDLIEEAGALTS